MYIDDMPRLTMRDLNGTLLRQLHAAEDYLPSCEENTIIATGEIIVGSFDYKYVLFSQNEEGYFTLSLHWEDPEGKRRCEVLALQYVESPICSRGYFYFICPFSQRRCRVLLQDTKGNLGSRYSFKGLLRYRSQYEKLYRAQSGKYAQILRFFQLQKLLDEEPETYYRKLSYAGRLTPFGKKYDKYIQKCERIAGLPPKTA